MKEFDNLQLIDQIKYLKDTDVVIPSWEKLEKEYNPMKHAVMDTATYPDLTDGEGAPTPVSRVPLAMQRLAVRRMTELAVGLPVKRIYHYDTDDERQKEVAVMLEKVFERNRIDSINIERCHNLYASCISLTLWYGVVETNNYYGFDSDIKLRCKNYSPLQGHQIYVKKDETDDVIAISIGYKVREDKKDVEYLLSYTKDKLITYRKEMEWTREEQEIAIGKIPAVYVERPLPIWENTSPLVNELEWTMSRMGNYIRANAKPIFGIFSDEKISTGKEPGYYDRLVIQYPANAEAKFITWEQSTEAVKMHVEFLRSSFFTTLQLPEFDFETMKSTPMSGEARKMMFIDAQLKVKDESGRLEEMMSREVNVVKAFLKIMRPEYADAIDKLQVEVEIVPFTINDERERIDNIIAATGGKAIASQKEGVQMLGWSVDVGETLVEIQNDEKMDITHLYE